MPYLLFFVAMTGISSSQSILYGPYATDGPVYAVAFRNNTIYIGGLFSQLGPATGSAALIDTATGKPDLSFPKVNGFVMTIVSDGAGGCYIGGYFTRVDGVARKNIAHIKSDKTLDADWDPNPNDRVTLLAVSGSVVYVCGEFTEIGGAARNFIAALEVSTGKATEWNPNPNHYVNALAISGSVIYVGGDFTAIGDSTRSKIAAIDAVTGKATSWNPNANAVVQTLAVSGSIVYAGGDFINIGSQARNHVAALDVSSGNATNWNPNANNSISVLVVADSIIYAAGAFDSIGGKPRKGIASLNASTGNATSWNTSMLGPRFTGVSSIVVLGSTLYVGGDFEYIGGAERKCIAKLDASTGNATTWDPSLFGGYPARDIFPGVGTLALSASAIYVGGFFSGVGGIARNNIAALDAVIWKPKDWNPNAGGPVFALAAIDSTVYVGGDFGGVGGAVRHSLAALNTSTGNATEWNPNIDSPYPFVWALAVSDSVVYVGGTFRSIGGIVRNNLAAIDRSTGRATDWNPGAVGLVTFIKTIALSDSTVYVGGSFTSISGTTRNNIAAINKTTGNVTDWNPNPNNLVYTLAVSGSMVYAGGYFTSIGGASRDHVAALDASTGSATDWSPDPNDAVLSLAVLGSTVYVGGDFTFIGGQARSNLAALDARTGNATNWNPNLDGSVSALTVDLTNERIYFAGGGFAISGVATSSPDGVDQRKDSPGEFALVQNYPNPFNPSTTIEYYLPRRVHVNLRIYNLLGQTIASLVDEDQFAGEHRVVWRPTKLSSGIYFCQINAGSYTGLKKLALVK